MFERLSVVTSRTNFAAESNGSVFAGDDADRERSMFSMSRAISSPVGSGVNSMRGCGGDAVTEADAAV